jgi:hypothetical protein
MANTEASGEFTSILKRFDALGRPDTMFGQNGVATVGNVGSRTDSPLKIALLSDDRIVVLSTLPKPLGEPTHFLARFNSDGRPDLGFGPNSSGRFELPSLGTIVTPTALTIDPQNRAIVTLSTSDTYQNDSMIIVRSNTGSVSKVAWR